jgi:hypothetical protein
MKNYGTRLQTDQLTRNKAESVLERVYIAVEHLCTAKGNVKERLIVAVNTLLPLRTREFPEELQDDFYWVITQSTQFENNVELTMKRIRNSTGEKIAKKIFLIYSKIQDIRGFPLLEHRDPKD